MAIFKIKKYLALLYYQLRYKNITKYELLDMPREIILLKSRTTNNSNLNRK